MNLFAFIRSFGRRNSIADRRQKTAEIADHGARLEGLEGRCLMSVSAVWDPTTHRLSVSGDNAADTILVESFNSDQGVVITGNNTNIPVRKAFTNDFVNTADLDIDDIYVYGNGGNDSITVNKSRDTYVMGGAGNDTIYGVNSSSRRDTIYGGAGEDTIYGRAGNDVLGGEGPDSADPFADKLYGGDGNDLLSGYGGDDSLYGQNGNDSLNGDSGGDYLEGGAGMDEMHGGTGNDWLDAHDGNWGEVVDGGSGQDTAVVDWFGFWAQENMTGVEGTIFG
jgi:Ca2+-binding RTX toxin-like protein